MSTGRVHPIEALQLAADLDGSRGTNRGPAKKCVIKARNDVEAIYAWLSEFGESAHTRRNYGREAERLLLWATHVRGLPLSSLGEEDILAYKSFAAAPAPAAIWIGAIRNTPRTSKEWRPFNGPLTTVGCRQALVILKGMFTYLVATGYLRTNPVALLKEHTAAPKKHAGSRKSLGRQSKAA